MRELEITLVWTIEILHRIMLCIVLLLQQNGKSIAPNEMRLKDEKTILVSYRGLGFDFCNLYLVVPTSK